MGYLSQVLPSLLKSSVFSSHHISSRHLLGYGHPLSCRKDQCLPRPGKRRQGPLSRQAYRTCALSSCSATWRSAVAATSPARLADVRRLCLHETAGGAAPSNLFCCYASPAAQQHSVVAGAIPCCLLAAAAESSPSVAHLSFRRLSDVRAATTQNGKRGELRARLIGVGSCAPEVRDLCRQLAYQLPSRLSSLQINKPWSSYACAVRRPECQTRSSSASLRPQTSGSRSALAFATATCLHQARVSLSSAAEPHRGH